MIRSIFLVPLLVSISGCASTASHRTAPETDVPTYVDRLVPVATPCDQTVKRPQEILDLIFPDLESKVEGVAKSDSTLRAYVPALEAAALRCGVKIE